MYKFNTLRFRNDTIECIERIGWDVFRYEARTTDKVICRVLGWSLGTVSTHTLAKFCNVMGKSPLIYYVDNYKSFDSSFYE